MEKRISRLEARAEAQQIVTLKLFEVLLFMKPPVMEAALKYLDGYAKESLEESSLHEQRVGNELAAQIALLRTVALHRSSAVEMREVLARSKKGPPEEKG